jgi:hypothetical protein
MTQETDNNEKLPVPTRQRVKKGSCLPRVDLPEEVADDLRSYIFKLIDTKRWAGKSDRVLAGDIINADEKDTELPRFYIIVDGERQRLSFEATRRLLKTYRHRSLEIFGEDLVPYIQEAIVEIIRTAGQKPANLKIILDALGVGKEIKNAKPDESDTPSSAYIKASEGMRGGQKRLEANVPKRTDSVTSGLRAFGYEGLMRDDISKRRRLAACLVSGRDDTGMDGPPNIIEVDGGPYSYPTLSSQDDILDYGREHLGDTERPEYSDVDKLGSIEVDERSDGND